MDLITVKPEMLKGVVKIPKLKGTDEGDFFLGAFFLVLGAIGNDIICDGLNLKSKQKNAKIIDIIKQAGGEIIETPEGLSAKMSALMRGGKIDAKGLEEILPAIAVLCAFCRGESRIYGIADFKQRDILKGIASELSHLGAYTEVMSDGLMIRGTQTINGDGTYAWNSSYLAMALVLAASRAEGEVSVMGIGNIQDKNFEKFMKLYKTLDGGN